MEIKNKSALRLMNIISSNISSSSNSKGLKVVRRWDKFNNEMSDWYNFLITILGCNNVLIFFNKIR